MESNGKRIYIVPSKQKSGVDGRKVAKCKWTYKVTYKPSWEVEWFKAHFVAKGVPQVAGVNAPIMKYDVVRAMLIIGNEQEMFKAQFDVCTTYLDVDLMHFIFMEQHEGFEDV